MLLSRALADRLAARGFEAAEDELVTPVAVAARMFASSPGARVLAVAADGVRQLLAATGSAPPRCWSAPAKATVPSQAPRPNRTR